MSLSTDVPRIRFRGVRGGQSKQHQQRRRRRRRVERGSRSSRSHHIRLSRLQARRDCVTTPLQNHLFIEDESQNFDEMRSVGSSSPAWVRFRNFCNCSLSSSKTVHFVRRYSNRLMIAHWLMNSPFKLLCDTVHQFTMINIWIYDSYFDTFNHGHERLDASSDARQIQMRKSATSPARTKSA